MLANLTADLLAQRDLFLSVEPHVNELLRGFRSTNLIGWAAHHLRHRLTTYNPNAADLGLSLFHHETAARLDELVTLRGQRDCVLAPRDSAKTTWRTIAYILRESLEGREPFIAVTSDSGPQAKVFLKEIRDELEDNQVIAAEYPNAAGRGPTWNEDEIELRNGVKIISLGTGEKMRGRLWRGQRPSLIAIDDPQNRDHIISPLQRDRSWEWLTKDVMEAGNPRTNILLSATALHRDGMAYRIYTQPLGWRVRLYQSVIEWPTDVVMWDRWTDMLHNYDDPNREDTARNFYEMNKPAMDAGARVLWPAWEPLYVLMHKFISMGPAAFGSEKQNNPTDPDQCEWPEAYFDDRARPEFWFDSWDELEGCQVKVLALDPSKGKKDRTVGREGDYTAYILYARDKKGVEWVEADMFRGSVDATVNAIINRGVQHVRDFGPDQFAFEAFAFQQLFAPLMRPALHAAGLDVHIMGYEDTTDKDVRIRRLSNSLAQRRFRFRRNHGTKMLVEQLRDFPTHAKKDGPDALELARRAGILLVNGRNRGKGVHQYSA